MNDKESFVNIVEREGIVWSSSCSSARSRFAPLAVLPAIDSVSDVSASAEYAANGIDPRRLKDMRKKTPEKCFDLHGLTVVEAYEKLDSFLASAINEGLRHIEIIHGRGAHSAENKAVLRDKTRAWLVACEWVLGYIETANNAGAVRVLLKSMGGRKSSIRRR